MSTTTPLRLGTRRSRLAMAQSGMIARALERVSGRPVELVQITSEGDTNRASLASLGGTGVFATRLREALAAGECDVLVHSLKDLPVAPAPGLVIQALPARADARDVVITRDGTPLDALPSGARVGTGSPRRIAQVARANPRVATHDLRGNIDSRMGRVRDGDLDAVILAAAGLGRVDAGGASVPTADGLHIEPRGLARWPTAAGQAALAVEIRQDADPQLRAWVSELDDPVTRFAVTVEREALGGIEAGCHAPVGVHVAVTGEDVRIRASVYAADPASDVSVDNGLRIPGFAGLIEEYIRGRGSGAAVDSAALSGRAREIGSDLARRLLDNGAADIVTREASPTS
ncbi:hydroxymethylbilane synthase [Microbacterium excoecariae]|uniref:hydroxymethylbilane synthase n=1 Tax=Microbacterium excoecariae TaxID=2715210 RepID=UPI001409A2B6|nr:hydroxymethylbilane synthase [Microbacterium excoecariae]NHI15806.1 hydroxymethylbilane synthase [Microbacterium excoecariae]